MKAYLPILLFLLVAIGFSGGTLLLSSIIVPRRKGTAKMSWSTERSRPTVDAS